MWNIYNNFIVKISIITKNSFIFSLHNFSIMILEFFLNFSTVYLKSFLIFFTMCPKLLLNFPESFIKLPPKCFNNSRDCFQNFFQMFPKIFQKMFSIYLKFLENVSKIYSKFLRIIFKSKTYGRMSWGKFNRKRRQNIRLVL